MPNANKDKLNRLAEDLQKTLQAHLDVLRGYPDIAVEIISIRDKVQRYISQIAKRDAELEGL